MATQKQERGFKVGDLVQYKYDVECIDKNVIFKVLEVRFDRLLVQAQLSNWTIKPTMCEGADWFQLADVDPNDYI